MTDIAAVIMLMSGGLWAGLILAVAVERLSLWARMPIDQYAVDFRRSLRRLDPLAPILGALAAAASVVYALGSSGAATVLAWVGVGLIVAVIVVSTAIAEPMNAQFRRRAEGETPPDAEAIRSRWRVLHLVRTVLALATFTALVLASRQIS